MEISIAPAAITVFGKVKLLFILAIFDVSLRFHFTDESPTKFILLKTLEIFDTKF